MRSFITLLTFALLAACGDSGSSIPDYTVPTGELIQWAHMVESSSFEGSATHCDLNDNGSLEAIIPIAVVDHPELSYLMVVDGVSGAINWQSTKGMASYAYPLCKDVNADGILDILTGGRTQDIVALSGINGQQIWSFAENNPNLHLGNTYAPVTETENSSIFFFSTGGGGSDERIPGKIFSVDFSGTLVSEWHEPENKEIYTSPAIYRSPNGLIYIAIGSGGENISGSIFILNYDENEKVFTLVASLPSSCENAGWISSPVFADVSGDGIAEIIATDYCSTANAFSLDGELHWSVTSELKYSTSNPAMADLNEDSNLDVIVVFSGLNWSIPGTYSQEISQVLAIDGLTGVILWQRSLNKVISSSPVSADFNDDNVEDIFLIGITGVFNGGGLSELKILSGKNGELLFSNQMASSSSTPALGDINANGLLDILYTESPAFNASIGGVILLEFPEVIVPTKHTTNSFRGMPVHNGYIR